MNSKLWKEKALFWAVTTLILLGCTRQEAQPETITEDPGASEAQAWQMEERYWEYVKNADTVAYKKLWHEDFIGYPSFSEGVSNRNGIAAWIPELHRDTSLTYHYRLHKKGVNAIDDVVMVFYDADEYWTDNMDNELNKGTYKLTHTWKKYGDTWLILGGMAAKKTQDSLGK